MNAFDKVIGYETIKQELFQICDMIHNPDIYEELGAKLPKGILLHGEPGLGKTLMAKCFIEESGLKSFILRRNKNTEDFVQEITDTFLQAKENAPAVIFLDDLDKFANEDDNHRDAQEYVAIQTGIDDVKESEVFVIATVNRIRKLPASLVRVGRFDRKIEVDRPSDKDSRKIIKHFLENKKISAEIDMEDIARMIRYQSCAELESIINEAAIRTAFERREYISMQDLTQAVLRKEFASVDDDDILGDDDLKKIALHEAGHLVVSEIICPGSVGFASVGGKSGRANEGFIRRCKTLPRRTQHILVSLGGKAAVELYHSDIAASGCQSDIESAYMEIRTAVSESATRGFSMIDVDSPHFPSVSENMNSRTEAVVHAELERSMYQVRDILIKNRAFLEKAADLLFEKKVLLYSDVQALRKSVEIVEMAV